MINFISSNVEGGFDQTELKLFDVWGLVIFPESWPRVSELVKKAYRSEMKLLAPISSYELRYWPMHLQRSLWDYGELSSFKFTPQIEWARWYLKYLIEAPVFKVPSEMPAEAYQVNPSLQIIRDESELKLRALWCLTSGASEKSGQRSNSRIIFEATLEKEEAKVIDQIEQGSEWVETLRPDFSSHLEKKVLSNLVQNGLVGHFK